MLLRHEHLAARDIRTHTASPTRTRTVDNHFGHGPTYADPPEVDRPVRANVQATLLPQRWPRALPLSADALRHAPTVAPPYADSPQAIDEPREIEKLTPDHSRPRPAHHQLISLRPAVRARLTRVHAMASRYWRGGARRVVKWSDAAQSCVGQLRCQFALAPDTLETILRPLLLEPDFHAEWERQVIPVDPVTEANVA